MGCTIKTGCGFDGHLVWSSSPVVDQGTFHPTDEFHVVCGKGTGCAEGNEQPAATAENHSIRCCSDVEMQGKGWKKQDQCAVWANSLTPHCHEASFAEAAQICEAFGARLCTKTELASRCTIKTGCGFDGHLVWSSSPVD